MFKKIFSFIGIFLFCTSMAHAACEVKPGYPAGYFTEGVLVLDFTAPGSPPLIEELICGSGQCEDGQIVYMYGRHNQGSKNGGLFNRGTGAFYKCESQAGPKWIKIEQTAVPKCPSITGQNKLSGFSGILVYGKEKQQNRYATDVCIGPASDEKKEDEQEKDDDENTNKKCPEGYCCYGGKSMKVNHVLVESKLTEDCDNYSAQKKEYPELVKKWNMVCWENYAPKFHCLAKECIDDYGATIQGRCAASKCEALCDEFNNNNEYIICEEGDYAKSFVCNGKNGTKSKWEEQDPHTNYDNWCSATNNGIYKVSAKTDMTEINWKDENTNVSIFINTDSAEFIKQKVYKDPEKLEQGEKFEWTEETTSAYKSNLDFNHKVMCFDCPVDWYRFDKKNKAFCAKTEDEAKCMFSGKTQEECSSQKPKDPDVTQKQIDDARKIVDDFFVFADSKADAWKDEKGNINAKRLASDLAAGVVLGTVGGVVSGVIIKKKQVEKGFEVLHCAIGGQTVADYGDTFSIGLRR